MAVLSTGQVTSTAFDPVFSHTIKLVQNDTLPSLTISLIDDNTGTPIDLSNASTGYLKLRAENATTVKVSIPLYFRAPRGNGVVVVEWPENALDTAGIFTGELSINYADGTTQTLYEELKFEIRGDY